MSAFLELNGVSKAYPGVQALRNVSFNVERGQVHALLGENGAGKSTLIRLLAGVESPDEGSMRLEDAPYHPATPREAMRSGVATIYQTFNLLPDRSLAHNVMLGSEPRTRFGLIDYKVMRETTRDLFVRLNAADLDVDRPVSSLRLSEKQLIEIAKALLHKSRLLIMDEPTSALNQAEAEALFSVISVLKAEGVTILYISHRLDEIYRLADGVTVLRDGAHILTAPLAKVGREQLVEAMIGRKITTVYPPRASRANDSAEVLRVESLSSENAFQNVSFTIQRGEILAVAGLSGCGKTELGKALYGALPSHGKLWVHGSPYKPSPNEALRRGLVFLPEDRKLEGILSELSVRRNISLSVLDRGVSGFFGIMSGARERKIAQEQIDALDIKTPTMEQTVGNLSGGNQQKVALGRCLAVKPTIFILMEPTQGIDVGVKVDLYRFIAAQADLGHSVLLVSSEISEILGLAHRILVMRDGAVAAEIDGESADEEQILRYAIGEYQGEM